VRFSGISPEPTSTPNADFIPKNVRARRNMHVKSLVTHTGGSKERSNRRSSYTEDVNTTAFEKMTLPTAVGIAQLRSSTVS